MFAHALEGPSPRSQPGPRGVTDADRGEVFDFLTFGALLLVFHAAPDLFRGWFVESLLTELVIASEGRGGRRSASDSVVFLHLRDNLRIGQFVRSFDRDTAL